MMRMNRFATLSLFVLMPGIAAAEDTIPSPEFASWNKFKKGTSVTLKMTSAVAGMNNETTVTTTLVETGPDKLVIETASVVKVAGMVIKSPPFKREVAKTVKVPDGIKKEDIQGGKPPGTVEEGTETLKIAGAEINTKWYKVKSEAAGTKTESKMWTSEDVPGLMVKMEATTAGALASTTKLELIEIKKP